MDTDAQLQTTRGSTVPRFSLAGEVVRARVVDIYDGDTFKAIFFLPMSHCIVKMCFRLAGIDTPELHPRRNINPQERERIIARAQGARQRLCTLLTDCPCPSTCIDTTNTRIVELHCREFDKYGRVLVDAYIDDTTEPRTHVNTKMVDEGLAVPYDGGTKVLQAQVEASHCHG